MSRTQQRSRRPLLPESLVRKRDEPDNDGRLKVRRAGVDRRIPNPVVQPAYYYGFLAEIEGEFPGPWFITFECTEWRWFNETLAHFMPGDYDLARLRGVLRGRDYATAWASSIGERLVLRHIYAAYLDAMTSRPPPLALYRCAVHVDQLRGFGLHDPTGQAGAVLRIGYWYGLELLPAAYCDPQVEPGMLMVDDPSTGDFAPPAAYRPRRIRNLRWLPYPRHDPGLDMFHSQATLLALHYARGL